MYIEGILERLNLQDHISEEGFMVLDGTIGEWLEHHDKPFLNYFISTATGKYLDFIGKEHDLVRRENESDDDYLARELITAWLMFTGGTYKDLANMAIKENEVRTLKLKSKENRAHKTVKVTKPNSKSSVDDIVLG